MAQGWQQPYVNIFKHFAVGEWKRCRKEGDVVKMMDRSVKASVYKINGSIPSSNYIQLPRDESNQLGLTGKHFYLLFKPIPGKYFTIHINVVSNEGLAIRLSFSSMYKEFKSTSTWLQFPLISNPVMGSVEEATLKEIGSCSNSFAGEPLHTRWTLLNIDLQYILSVYLNKHYMFIKSLRLCAAMHVKNAFTSNINFEPGLDVKLARKSGLLASGVSPLPRDINLPLEKYENWHKKYDHITLPSNNKSGLTSKDYSKEIVLSKKKSIGKENIEEEKQPSTFQASQSRLDLVEKTTLSLNKSLRKKRVVDSFQELPEITLNESCLQIPTKADVHIYSSRVKQSTTKNNKHQLKEQKINKVTKDKVTEKPLIILKKIIGFGGITYNKVLWSSNGTEVIYPCHAVIVIHNIATGKQRFLLGHTHAISSLARASNTQLLSSVQSGVNGTVRLWKYNDGKCIAVFPSTLDNCKCISLSSNGNKLCVVGENSHGRQVICVWNITLNNKIQPVTLVAKAHTELQTNAINTLMFTPFDENRIVSCGRYNIRVWRIKANNLRSCIVDLKNDQQEEFTDISFTKSSRLKDDPQDCMFYASTLSGFIFQIHYKSFTLIKKYELSVNQEKNESLNNNNSIYCIVATDNFCFVGTKDGVLRIWPLNFKTPFLEAEHDGMVTGVSLSSDEKKVLVATNTGGLGILDLTDKSYHLLTRSHTDNIISFAFEYIHGHIATVSQDKSIKLWDLKNFNQIYDFEGNDDVALSICFNPIKNEFVCGFASGKVCLFNLNTTALERNLREHNEGVHSVFYSSNGKYLYTGGEDGNLCLYETFTYELRRSLTDVILQNVIANQIVCLDDKTERIAVIGPSEYHVTVLAAESLDELLHIDISTINYSTVVKSTSNIDKATSILFSPSRVGHLIVATSNSRVLKFNSATGQLLSEVSNPSNHRISSFCVSPSCKYLVTAEESTIKVWDYNMQHQPQVFIGHCNAITDIKFSADESNIVSCGETLFIWKVLDTHIDGKRNDLQCTKQPFTETSKLHLDNKLVKPRFDNDFVKPRLQPPTPAEQPLLEENDQFDLIKTLEHSRISISSTESDEDSDFVDFQIEQKEHCEAFSGTDKQGQSFNDQSELRDNFRVDKERCIQSQNLQLESKNIIDNKINEISHDIKVTNHAPPNISSHFKATKRYSTISEKRYVAPLNQCGMKLEGVVGFNGNSRNSIAWHPETGFFAYLCGCMIVIEDLYNGKQNILSNQSEELSTLALQYDGQMLAVASTVNKTFASISIWNVTTYKCDKVLEHHNSNVIGLQYSRDDRFLISIGDYKQCMLVIWNAKDYSILTETCMTYPIHSVQWHPYRSNEFAVVGRQRMVAFAYLSEHQDETTDLIQIINGHVPKDLFSSVSMTTDDMTSLSYAGQDILLTGTSFGIICLWSISNQHCFMHWQADSAEISYLHARYDKIISGSASKNLKCWTLLDMNNQILNENSSQKSLILEDEKKLDGDITGGMFDDTLSMGVVGTHNGSIWCIDFADCDNNNVDDIKEDIRIVSGHQDNISNFSVCKDGDNTYLATSSCNGSLKLWEMKTREQTSQFLVIGQTCTCVTFCSYVKVHQANINKEYDQVAHPLIPFEECPTHCIAGYNDGTIRRFDFAQMQMLFKVKPYTDAVTDILCSHDGEIMISGSITGSLVVSSMSTGITITLLNDHMNASICCIRKQKATLGTTHNLWLASSMDCRISVWKSDWSKDQCELVDWISFPAHVQTSINKNCTDGDIPTLVEFCPINYDVIIYTGRSLVQEISFYSLSKKKVIRTLHLTDWCLTMDVSPDGNLIAMGTAGRLVKLMDSHAGSFQDFIGHTECLTKVRFTSDGRYVISVALNELFFWNMLVDG